MSHKKISLVNLSLVIYRIYISLCYHKIYAINFKYYCENQRSVKVDIFDDKLVYLLMEWETCVIRAL